MGRKEQNPTVQSNTALVPDSPAAGKIVVVLGHPVDQKEGDCKEGNDKDDECPAVVLHLH